MSDVMHEAAVLRNAESISITTGIELQWSIDDTAKCSTRLKTPNLLHLTCAASLDRAAIRFVPRRIRRHQKRDVASKIARAGPKSTHRAKRAMGQDRFGFPRSVFPTITERDVFARHRRHFKCRRSHAERTQNIVTHVVGVGFTGSARDDLAENSEAIVRVFKSRSRRRGKRNSRTHPRPHSFVGLAQLSIAPRVVF